MSKRMLQKFQVVPVGAEFITGSQIISDVENQTVWRRTTYDTPDGGGLAVSVHVPPRHLQVPGCIAHPGVTRRFNGSAWVQVENRSAIKGSPYAPSAARAAPAGEGRADVPTGTLRSPQPPTWSQLARMSVEELQEVIKTALNVPEGTNLYSVFDGYTPSDKWQWVGRLSMPTSKPVSLESLEFALRVRRRYIDLYVKPGFAHGEVPEWRLDLVRVLPYVEEK